MSKEREFLKKLRYATHLENDLREELEELLIQPVREPEAWILEDKKTGYRRQSAYKPTDLDEEACNVIPLYTAPPVKSEQTEQEPVAWIIQTEVEGKLLEWVCTDKKHYMEEHDSIKEPIPLYTAPPKREPLSFEDLNTMWCGNPIDFARRIESIHGIGEENE